MNSNFARMAFCLCAALASPAAADTLTFKHLGQNRTIQANVLGRALDGTLVVEGPDTQDYFIAPSDLVGWKDKGVEVKPLSREQLKSQLKKEYGGDFYFVETNHYIIVHDCDSKLARQAGTLLERAYNAVRGHFANKGAFRFENLRQPLIAVIYKTRKEYLEATKNQLGDTLTWSAGMYSPKTNRFYMFDAFQGSLDRKVSIPAQMNGSPTRHNSPLDSQNVELVIHEGTHQLAFNFGIHNRLANNPFWLVEGLATYFEAADGSATEGWKRAGELNPYRLAEFAKIFPSLRPGHLDELVTNDKLYQEGDVAQAYAQGWALTYYLMRAKQTSYIRYVRAVQARGYAAYPAKDRITDFKSAFGATPKGIEDDFNRYMAGILMAELKKAQLKTTASK